MKNNELDEFDLEKLKIDKNNKEYIKKIKKLTGENALYQVKMFQECLEKPKIMTFKDALTILSIDLGVLCHHFSAMILSFGFSENEIKITIEHILKDLEIKLKNASIIKK